MGNSWMIATRKRDVFMAHICSECGFPMITVVQIEAEAQKTYVFSQSKAGQIASETAENAIREEMMRIESCYSTNQVLVGTHKGNGMIAPGHFCTSSFRGYASRCPRCLNIEPWKSNAAKKRMNELNKENFPTVFADADKAESWAFSIVRKLVAEILKKREDNSAVGEAIERVIESKIRLEMLREDLDSIPETFDRDRLKTELANAEKLKLQLGILDFKNKRIVNERINIIKLQIKDLSEIIEKKETPIADRIIELENELLFTQSIAFGCSDGVLSKKRGNAFSYFFSPNDIPDHITSKIEHHNGDTVKTVLEPQEEALPVNEDIEKPVFCRKCGYKLLADSAFCTKCGAKVT